MFFDNYCKSCGLVIIGKGKTRCTPCQRGFLKAAAEKKIEAKKNMQEMDILADKELTKYYKDVGVII